MDGTPGKESPRGSPQGTPTHYELGNGYKEGQRQVPSPFTTPQGRGLRLENLMASSSVGARTPFSLEESTHSIDEILIQLVEGKKVEQITDIPIEYFGLGIVDEEDTDTDLFTDIFLEPAANAELVKAKNSILTEEEKREESAEDFTDLDPEKYESIDIDTGAEGGETIKVSEEVRPIRTRDKRMSTPSGKIREIQKTIEEQRQIKEILSERKKLNSVKRRGDAEVRAKRKEEKEKELSDRYEELPPHVQIELSPHSYTGNNNASSTATVQGLTKQECVDAGLVLTRGQRTEGGSDFSMMHYLHCPSTKATPDDIGELPDCLCWLCGFPMLTRNDIRRETIMMKRNLGQVSPEHTLPMTAGNALIGLPTKAVKERMSADVEYEKEVRPFLKKGLTYSHFWCNEVKNALRLVTWPEGELPKPNTKNINWLLNYMWHGINRGAGINRWFDEKACFVLYTAGATNYKFSNLIHYFVLKPFVTTPLTEDIIHREREQWLDMRRRSIHTFLQGICDDIKRYTILYHNLQKSNPLEFIPDIRELSETLKIVYKDRVISGPNSQIVWPPTRFLVAPRAKNTRRRGLKGVATGKVNQRKLQEERAQKRRTNRRNEKINKIRRGVVTRRRR